MDEFKPIVGKCLFMCPKQEVNMRTREGLLHRLERGPDYQPVKEYTRAAAGLAEEHPSCIRPPQVLENTLNYLFNTIVAKDKRLEVFTFVSNRLRSVKQDLFKQQCSASIALPILEPIVRYFAWAAYWYCEEPGFEKHLHDLLLLECLKECLRLSDQDNVPTSTDIEALYVLYTLGQSDGILRTFNSLFPQRTSLLHQCQTLSIHWFHGHFTTVCKNIKKLPPLLLAFVSVKHLETIRKYGLIVMSNSFCCKNMITPWEALQHTHMFSNKADAIDACKFYSITVEEKGPIFHRILNITDNKRNFKKPQWIEEKLKSICFINLFFTDDVY